MSIRIENATLDELEILYTIERECFTLEAFSKKQLISLLQSPHSISLLAKMNGEIVGFIIALTYKRKDEKVGHIYTLDIAKKARRKGLGFKLIECLEQVLREKGVKLCLLETGINNVAARELYRKLGYVEIKLVKNFYPQGDAVRLQKVL